MSKIQVFRERVINPFSEMRKEKISQKTESLQRRSSKTHKYHSFTYHQTTKAAFNKEKQNNSK